MIGEVVGIVLIIVAYLLGSIPFTYIIGRIFFGKDIRQFGSGNIGGANAMRIFGKKYGIVGGALDILKGTIVIIIAQQVLDSQNYEFSTLSEDIVIALVGFFVVFGHCFSIYLKFSGGKGAATTAGTLIALDLMTFFILLIIWIIIVGSTRFTSLGNLLAVIIIPLMFDNRMDSGAYLYFGIGVTFLFYYKHRTNIVRLLGGEERKFGNKEEIN